MLFIKNKSALTLMAEGGKILASCMEMLENSIKEGMSTLELDKLAYKYIISNGAKPSFLGMYGFPNTLCISVNEEVIHGIPKRNKIIKNGDLVSVDGGVYLNGFHTDMARTFMVGDVKEDHKLLVERTKQSFYEGMSFAREGCRVSDISNGVEKYINQFGYGIVKEFTGHGVGRELHESPEIPNYGPAGRGTRIVNGMTLAIEPMINLGTGRVEVLKDGWTTVTLDSKVSAHWENTVAVIDGKPVILTDSNVNI